MMPRNLALPSFQPLTVAFSQSSDGLMVLLGNRLVWLSRGAPDGVPIAEEFAGLATNRDFFKRALTLWARCPEPKMDIVCLAFDEDRTVVLLIGGRSVEIETDQRRQCVSVESDALLLETIVPGRLISACLGSDALPYCAQSGVLPVGSFAIYPTLVGEQANFEADRRLLPSPGPLPTTDSAASDTSAPKTLAAPVAASQPEPPAKSSPEPVVTAASFSEPIVADAPAIQKVGISAQETQKDSAEQPETDDYADGMTVWPVLGSKTADLVGSPANIAVESSELTEILPAHRLDPAVEAAATGEPKRIEIEDLQVPAATFGGPEVSSIRWESGNHKSDIYEGLDESDLTVGPKELEKFRRSIVEMAPASQATPSSSDQVAGTYCENGHFTDPRKPKCIYCGGETDFSKFEIGPRPSLGVLEFDDGRRVNLSSSILIGRKPSAAAGGSELVAFEDDRMLSRVHLEVAISDWDVVIRDRQSANGTTVNFPDGRVIPARPNLDTQIDSGCVVLFGKHSFTFRSGM